MERLRQIIGEWHPVPLPDGTVGTQGRLLSLLGPTHDVAFTGPTAGPGGFAATRRE